MKTLYPVDEETYAKIGKAYLICSEHPDIFGSVTMERFCSMFVDVIPEGEDERTARMKEYAPEMYELLNDLALTEKPGQYIPRFLDLKDKARKLLDSINGEEAEA